MNEYEKYIVFLKEKISFYRFLAEDWMRAYDDLKAKYEPEVFVPQENDPMISNFEGEDHEP